MDLGLGNPRLIVGSFLAGLVAFGYLLWVLLKSFWIVLAIVVILACIGIIVWLLVKERRAAQASNEIEATITRQADHDIERSTVDQAHQLKDLKSELMTALEALRSSRVGKAGGKSALSKLPWYLVLGPADSGKGTLIRESGLRFPSASGGGGPRSFRGMGGTRTFEWWLSDEAVLLDMPGRFLYAGDFEDSDDWFTFLGTLRKHRPAQPLNGIIVAVSAQQIASMTDANLGRMGSALRKRARDLTGRLGVVLPIYVVVTACDRLLGFTEFFADLDPGQRLQPWGAMLKLAARGKEPYDARFEQEFDSLLGNIRKRRLDAMQRLPDPVQRARVHAFASQVAALRDPMRRFVRALFEAGGEPDAPLLRGFYLCAAAPRPAADDHVFARSAASLGLGLEAMTQPAPAPGGSWFVRDLFTRVVLPDRNVANRSPMEEERRRSRRRVVFAVLGAALVLLAGALSGVSCMNQSRFNQVRDAAGRTSALAEATLPARIDALDSLRASIVRLENGDRDRWRHLVGYHFETTAAHARRVHAIECIKHLIAPGLRKMTLDLRDLSGPGKSSFERYFYLYWAWHLLMRPADLDPGSAPVVAGEVRNAFGGQLQGYRSDETQRYAEAIERNVQFVAREAEHISLYRGLYEEIPEDPALLEQAEAHIRLNWNPAGFYGLLIDQARPWTRDLGYAEIVEGRDDDLLQSSRPVPGPYTRAGWDSVIHRRLEWFRDRMTTGWIPERFDSAAVLPDRLDRQYSASYARAWGGFLDSVRAIPGRTWPEARARLERLKKPGSPLFRILARVRSETDLGPEASEVRAQVRYDFRALHSFGEIPGTPAGQKPGFWSGVGRFFSKIFSWLPGRKKPTSDQQSLMGRYALLLDKLLEPVRERSMSGKEFQDLGIYMPKDKEESLVRQFHQFSDELCTSYPEGQTLATISLLQQPLHLLPDPPVAYMPTCAPSPGPRPQAEMGGPSVGAARMPGEVGEPWRSVVVGAFNSTLRGKYPVERGSSTDSDPAAFARFFGPNGTFWTFFHDKLTPYFNEDGSLKEGAANYVTPELSRAVRQAREIRDNFNWGPDGASLRLDVQVEAAEGPGGLPVWMELEIGGSQPTLRYFLGEPLATGRAAMDWPGLDPARGISVRAGTPEVVAEASRPGVWGLFRLLDRSEVRYLDTERVTQVKFKLTTETTTWIVPYRFRVPGIEAKQPFRRGLFNFSLPQDI